MSAPLTLNAYQVKHLGEFLYELSALTRKHNVEVHSYGSEAVKVGDCVLEIKWTGEEYVIDDRERLVTAHDPIKRMVTIAGIGRRFEIVCPCGNTPRRRLDAEEAREEMRRHPVEVTA